MASSRILLCAVLFTLLCSFGPTAAAGGGRRALRDTESFPTGGTLEEAVEDESSVDLLYDGDSEPEDAWDSQAQAVHQSCAAEVDEQLSAVADAIKKALPLASNDLACTRRVRRAAMAVEGGKKLMEAGTWGKARNKAAWARHFLSQCTAPAGTRLATQLTSALALLGAPSSCLAAMANSAVLAETLAGTPATALLAEGGGANVAASANSYDLTFRKATYKGARLRSASTFTSGKFAARIKCPTGESADGLNTAFFLSSDADDSRRSSITMEFPGFDRSIVLLNTMVDGESGWNMVVDLEYDCSQDFHVYSIYWTPEKIMWKSDNNVLEIYDKTMWLSSPVPNKPLYLYLALSNKKWLSDTWGVRVPDGADTFTSSFHDVVYQSPISAIPDFPTALPDARVYPIGIDNGLYGGKTTIESDSQTITCDASQCGGRFHSTRYYASGEFTGSFKCPAGDTSGLLSSLYLSSKEGYQVNGEAVQDEIDFEWLGKDKYSVQTNYYVNGVGGHEGFIDLGFDCSEAFHTYTIRYGPTMIQWLVDGAVRQTAQKDGAKPFPAKPVFFYASVWNASSVKYGDWYWTGKWDGKDMPFVAHYKGLRITPLSD